MNFKQIPNDFPTYFKVNNYLLYFGGAGLFALFYYLGFVRNESSGLILFVIAANLLVFFSRFLSADWVKKKDVIGNVSFKNDTISYGEKSIATNEIKNVLIHSNGVKGKLRRHRAILYNGIFDLQITTNAEEKHHLKFMIENKKQHDFMKQVIENWYKNKIEIKEFYSEEKYKTICLEMINNKNYKEIQELKKKIQG